VRNSAMRLFTAGALVLSIFLPAAALAAQGDCSQPSTNNEGPRASDCLAILKVAVGAQACLPDSDEECICDVSGDGNVRASDALQCLRYAVGQVGVTLDCDCPPVDGGPACTSAELFVLSGSDLDSGWTGIAHNAEVIEGGSVLIRTLRRCSISDEICVEDEDCPSGELCNPTCDCNEGGDTDCEIAGPVGQKRCVTTLAACDSDGDCPSGVACKFMFGPPLPLSSAGNPVCVVSIFDSEFTGTSNAVTGDSKVGVNLKSRVFLGDAVDQPCPRCGRLGQNLELGATFTCDDGQFPGADCTIDSISPDFGGVSFDCPPTLGANISGAGLSIIFDNVTTGTVTKTAKLPCSNFLLGNNPLNGPATCVDNGDSCSTNADCLRCDDDPRTVCSTNGDCGGGACAAAPIQPITCGHWCHCGFCDDDPTLPCFDDESCPGDSTCTVGSGSVGANAPQSQPNECGVGFKFICGLDDKELCPDNLVGTCSLQSFRSCNDDSTCAANSAGVCQFEFKPCFEAEITRDGVPSPLGSYCANDPDNPNACTSDADCAGDDTCVDDSSRPTTAALFCVPATSSSTINSAGGLTGPGAISLKSFIQVCRCGDGEIGCDETCDDSNFVGDDGCDENCQTE
jgi:hypothetical protein